MKKLSLNLWAAARFIGRTLFELLFQAEINTKLRWFGWIWLLGVFLLGLYWFWIFFEGGTHSLEFHDWATITGPRFQFLKNAVQTFQLPLHISDPSTFHGYTIRYLSVPDTLISPQFVLLFRLSIQRFNLANVWILYTLGFAGLLVLKKQLRISLVPFTLMALLVNFNGNILAHYSVGHATWGGYFLFPWFVWLVFRLLQGDRSWKWTLGMSALLFVIWLQGSFHQFVWLLMLLALIAVFVPRTFWFVMRTGAITFLVSAFRFLPAVLSYNNYSGGFDNGFPTLGALFNYLIFMASPLESKYFQMGTGPAIGAWELTTFIGLVGTIFVIYFGVVRGMLTRQAPFRALALPLGAMLLLTGGLFDVVDRLHLPLLGGERITSRMILAILVFGIIIAAERFQHWLDGSDQRNFLAAGSLMAFSLTGIDLWLNLNVWKLSHSSQLFDWVYFNPAKWFVKNDFHDTLYIGLVLGGLVITILTLGALSYLSWKETRSERSSRHSPEPHDAITS